MNSDYTQNNNNSFVDDQDSSSLNIKENVELLLRNWYWFALSILICFFAAYFYLKYQQNIYQANASVLIEEKGSLMVEQFQGLEDVFGTSNKVQDNTYIFKSIPLNERVVDNLNLDVTLSRKTSLSKKLVDYYNNAPIQIVKLSESDDFLSPINFQINLLKNGNYEFISGENKKPFSFNQPIQLNNQVIINVLKNPNYREEVDSTILVKITPLEQRTMEMINGLLVNPADQQSDVLQLSYKDNNLQKAKDVLNELIKQYSLYDVADKKAVADNTSKFINDRITLLTNELSGVEKNIERFKKNNKLTDIVTEAKIYSDNASNITNELSQAQVKSSIVNYLSQYINQNGNVLIPTNIGLDDANVSYQIDKYNQMVLELNRYAKTTTPENPEYQLLEQNIQNQKRSIAQELSNQKGSLNITISGLKSQNNTLNSKLQNIPQQERQYREIFRQQQTKEALFLFLLQKKEEVAIAGISITPDFKTVNNAYGSLSPVSPNKKLIYLIALILGIIIPIVLIYLRQIMDTKIHTPEDLEKVTNLPVIGNISKHEHGKNNPVLTKTDRTSTAESMRLVVTNIEFILAENPDAKTILVTSTLSGEGKTFISVNLATNLAYNGYKVALIGMDIRSPKIQEYFDIANQKGVTHFVRNNNLTVADITNQYPDIPNLDVITSGTILPNFIDILTNKRIDELFAQLKADYDYVIIDSAPVGLVSDTFNISKYIDLCLYVVRANYLDKRMIRVAERINKEKKFPKIYLILNDVDVQSKKYGNSYGYGYGYGYGTEKKEKPNFWQKKYWKDLLLRK